MTRQNENRREIFVPLTNRAVDRGRLPPAHVEQAYEPTHVDCARALINTLARELLN